MKMTEQRSQAVIGARGEAEVGAGKLEGRHYLMEQEPDCLESLFCCFCEGENEYAISETDPNYNVASKKGYIKETSDCLSRVFCVCNRPFEAKMRLFGQDVAVAQRNCKYSRPHLGVVSSTCPASRTKWSFPTLRVDSWECSE